MKIGTLKRFAASAVITTALGAATLTIAPAAYAAPNHGQCQRTIERREVKLDQAIHRFGERSRQAEQRRRELTAERERCWSKYHGWWDGREHRWHEDRDWDRH